MSETTTNTENWSMKNGRFAALPKKGTLNADPNDPELQDEVSIVRWDGTEITTKRWAALQMVTNGSATFKGGYQFKESKPVEQKSERMDALEQRVASQDAKLDAILAALSK